VSGFFEPAMIESSLLVSGSRSTDRLVSLGNRPGCSSGVGFFDSGACSDMPESAPPVARFSRVVATRNHPPPYVIGDLIRVDAAEQVLLDLRKSMRLRQLPSSPHD
jgi:hypothetical protein